VNHELAGTLAAANGDPILQSIHFSLDEDAQWHRAWSAELLHMAIRDTPMNRDLVQGWVDARLPPAIAAVDALVSVIDRAPVRLDGSAVRARVTEGAHADVVAFLDAFPGP
jgi:toluene monooxygenase system protein E